MAFMCTVTIYPLLNTLALSFNDGFDANRGGIYIWPRVFTTLNYTEVFKNPNIIKGYIITISRTVIGTIVTLFCTGVLAYALSKKHLLGRKLYLNICIFCMLFYAGLIPTYMLYRDVRLINNFLVYILPGAVNIWFMMLMKTFFEQIPADLEDSAMLDGASTMRIFLQIIIPVSLPIIATICIFSAVAQWNSWWDAYMFVTRREDLHPVQTYLYRVVALSQKMIETPGDQALLERFRVNVVTVRAATVILTTVPILFIYAIFQKQFIKGVMIGALKG
jgi:putative aldouronate transport system permease protein